MDLKQKNQHWFAIFAQQKCSGLTITQFCRKHKLNTSTFYAWRHKVAKQNNDKLPLTHKQQLVPLMVSEPELTRDCSLTITTPTGYQLTFNEQLSPTTLVSVLKVLP